MTGKRSARPRISVIGLGQMGTQHARVLAHSDSAELHRVADRDEDLAKTLAEEYGCGWGGGVEAAAEGADGVILATPTEHHVPDALELIEAAIPVLVEKPIAEDLADVERVLAAAAKGGVPIMCGFVERHNPALATALELLEEPPHHAFALRHSPPADRIKTSVVWDLLIHDIDVALSLDGDPEKVQVQSSGWRSPSGSLEIADCSLTFQEGRLVTLSSSRASQRKIRTWTIATTGQLIEVDLLRQDVTVYRNLTQEAGAAVGYRANTVVDIPYVRHGGEPLTIQLEHFTALLDGKTSADHERESILAPHQLAAGISASLEAVRTRERSS